MKIMGQPVKWKNLKEFIEDKALKNNDKVLMYFEDSKLTYKDADINANRIANSLCGLGVKKGDKICTLMYNSLEHICIWFACAKIGAVWVPINVTLRGNDLSYTINDSEGKMIIIDEELLQNYLLVKKELAHIKTEIILGEKVPEAGMMAFEKLLQGDTSPPKAKIDWWDPICITFTGGTTGMPKGVLCSHFQFLCAGYRYFEFFRPNENDCHFTSMSLFHAGAQQWGVMGPMVSNISSSMAKWFSASKFWDRVKKYNATLIDPPGTMITAICNQEKRKDDRDNPARLGKGATAGIGEGIRDEFEKRFNVKLIEMYALTETGIVLIFNRPDDFKEGSCGKGHGWADIAIVDKNDDPLPPGEIGEILLRPKHPYSFMIGYYNKPKATLEVFRNLWFHTGDLGYLDEEGFLFLIGRQAHWLRTGGENVACFEVENVINQNPKVAESAVVGVPAELGEEDVKAYVVLEEGELMEPLDVIKWCEDRLARFKVPRYIEFVMSLPKSITKSEIERHKLKKIGIGDAWDREKIGYKLKR